MDKEKNSSIKLLLPKDYIYLTVIFLMTLIFGFDNVLLLLIGFSIFAIVLFVAVKMNKAKRQEIEKHIESLAFNIDIHEGSIVEGELAFIYLMMFILMYISGPGQYSIDAKIHEYLHAKDYDAYEY